MAKASNGHAVDSEGKTVADPSLNVGALVLAEGRRQDDLRIAERLRQDDLRIAERLRQDDLRLAAKELADVNNLHAKEIAALNVIHGKEMAEKESSRVDSLRQGDREETTRATVATNTATMALAKTTTDLQTSLQKQVADAAVSVDNRQNAYAADVNKHFAEIDRALSEGKGSKQVTDPALERLVTLVGELATAQKEGAGHSLGINDFWKVLIAIVMIFFAWSAWQSRPVTPVVTQSQPQVIYVPLPPGSAAPIQAPQTTPR